MSIENSSNLTEFAKHIEAITGTVKDEIDIANAFSSETLPIMVVPSEKNIVDLTSLLEQHLPRPRRLKEAATVCDVDSLVKYVNRFKDATGTVLFYQTKPENPWIKAIIDYHIGTEAGRSSVPSFCHHSAIYSFPLSDEMKTWCQKASGDMMSMEEFAWLLEEREHDIANPPVNWAMLPEAEIDNICRILNLRDDFVPGQEPAKEDLEMFRQDAELPAGYRTKLQKLQEIRFGTQQQLLTLSREMSVRTDSRIAQKIDLQGGARVLVFEEDQQAEVKGARVKVPEMFLIDIPIFDGEERRLMPVRLYYRKSGSSIRWAIQLVDSRRMIRDAVKDVAGTVADATGVPLICGVPGALAR